MEFDSKTIIIIDSKTKNELKITAEKGINYDHLITEAPKLICVHLNQMLFFFYDKNNNKIHISSKYYFDYAFTYFLFINTQIRIYYELISPKDTFNAIKHNLKFIKDNIDDFNERISFILNNYENCAVEKLKEKGQDMAVVSETKFAVINNSVRDVCDIRENESGVRELENKIKDMEEEISKIKKENEELKKDKEYIEDDNKCKIDKYIMEINEYKSKLDDKEKEYKIYEDKIKKLKEIIKEKDMKINDILNKENKNIIIDNERQNIEKLNIEIDELNKKNTELECENDLLREEYKECIKEIEILEKKFVNLTDSFSKKVKAYEEENKQLKELKEKNEEKYKKLKCSYNELQEKIKI